MSVPIAAAAASPADDADLHAAIAALEPLERPAMVLESFQRRMLRDFFAGTTETLVLIPKKNGKSTTLAALALFHLVTTPDAECVIAAASREQATILFDQAVGFVRRSEPLQTRVIVKRGYREIRSLRHNGRVRVLASDVDTADGVIPTLALVDELHRHKSADLYGVFRDGLGPRSGRLITISTAGDDETSPLGRMRDAAGKLPVVERPDGEAYRYCRKANGDYVMHEWALDPGDDRSDMRVVKRANPASWQTVELLARRHDSPSMTPWQWGRFGCGVWLAGENGWLQASAWDACLGDARLPDAVWLGVDIGQRDDSSAVSVCGWVDGRLHVATRIWDPRQLGQDVDLLEVEAHIVNMAKAHSLRGVAYDAWRFKRSATMLEERGLPMVEFPQTPGRMAPASAGLYELIRQRKVVHGGDEALRRHVLAGVKAETENGWRISKKKSAKKIDALIALAMAADLAGRKPPEPPRRRRAVFV